MHCSIQIYPYRLVFRKPAGTSRGVYLKRDVWYIYLTSNDYPGRVGIGECAPLPNLSCDDFADYETRLRECCDHSISEDFSDSRVGKTTVTTWFTSDKK